MSLARCSRCESLYYSDRAGEGCCYHSGKFRSWWSCCKEPLFGAQGCRTGAHQEDVSYTAMLDAYAYCAPTAVELDSSERCIIQEPDGQLSYAGVIVTTDILPSELPVEGKAEVAMPAPPPEMGEDPAAEARPESSAPSNANGGDGDRTVTVPFVVSMFDTFASICLKHRMSADELMRLNGLRHRRARVGDVLLVWAERSDAEQSEHWQRRLLRQFRRQTGCPAGEALYYMEQCALACPRPASTCPPARCRLHGRRKLGSLPLEPRHLTRTPPAHRAASNAHSLPAPRVHTGTSTALGMRFASACKTCDSSTSTVRSSM